MLAALAVLLNKRSEALVKTNFIWTGQHILGIRKYRICVHDCFLVKKVGHILGIMEFLICIHECFIVKKAVGEITLVSDFWILQVIGNLLFSLIGNSPSWFLHLTVRTLEAAECTISRGLAVSQIRSHIPYCRLLWTCFFILRGDPSSVLCSEETPASERQADTNTLGAHDDYGSP